MKRSIKIIIFIIILIITFIFLNRLFNPVGTKRAWKTSSPIIDYYREAKNSIDILFVGNSNVYADISPLEIYSRYGVTGYSYSSPEQKVWSSYYLIKEALKTQKPKVLFLETGEFFSDSNDQTEQNKRKAIDPIRLSQNKIDMINDSVYGFSTFDKLSCIMPLLRYHSRWTDLGWDDIQKLYSQTEYDYEGYIFDNNVKSYTNKRNEDQDTTNILQMPDTVRRYLDKIVDLCGDNDCQLILISTPTPTAWCQEKHDDLDTYALQNGLNFIDLNTDDNINIDWQHDSSDGGLHLNIYGAERVGEYLANYIDENFELPDHRGDKNYNSWNIELEKYDTQKSQVKAN